MSHVIMKKSLAKALMDAGMEDANMQHFAFGGISTPSAAGGPGPNITTPASAPNTGNGLASMVGNNQYTNPGGVFGGNNSVANQVFNPVGVIGGQLLNATQDNFNAATAGNTQNQILQQYGNQQDVYGQQQGLANQLLQQTQGQGPGAALIAQQGARNTANEAATLAGQRGASANPALAARQAAIAQGTNDQNVINAQSNQELQSQGALAQLYGNMSNQSLQGQSIGQGALASQNQVNAGVAATNAQTAGGMVGGLIGGGASAVSSMLSKGGEVKGYDVGGSVTPSMNPFDTGMASDAVSAPSVGVQNYAGAPAQPQQAGSGGKSGGGIGSMIGAVAALLAHGGDVKSFGQMLAGGNVPGQAKASGDSKKNDTVPTMLSPGEIVLPRSVTQAPDMEAKAVEFLKHLKNKKKRGYEAVADARRAK